VVLSMTVLSGELSVSTDRMIASLRAQEPVRLVDRRRHQPGGRADEALYAPGQLRHPDRRPGSLAGRRAPRSGAAL
jgi:hypothetical protein